MTLDEYKMMIEKEKPQVSYNVRQANEGEKGFPKNAVTLKKLSENELESDSSLFFPRRVCPCTVMFCFKFSLKRMSLRYYIIFLHCSYTVLPLSVHVSSDPPYNLLH